jgi:virulence factor Mce-like protein
MRTVSTVRSRLAERGALRGVATIASVLAMLVVGLAYLLLGVVRWDPFADPVRVSVDLAGSGGLLDRSDVTLRGYPVGRVEAIELRPGGVRVRVALDEGTRIPADTDAVVAALSAAGEQFLDFRPRTDDGPVLADGAVVAEGDTRTPVPFGELITTVDTLTTQLDPAQLAVVVGELSQALDGAGPDLARIIDGGRVLVASLDSVLPETVRTLRNGRVVLGSLSDLRDELARVGTAARGFTATLREGDPVLRDLLATSPDTFALISDVVRVEGPTFGALLGDLATVGEIAADRLPAIGEFLPRLAQVGPAAATVARDGTVYTIVDLEPRPLCDYRTEHRPPTIGGKPPPRIHKYCTVEDPLLQQRGSANVPRPPGDTTAGPPEGATGEERAQTGG